MEIPNDDITPEDIGPEASLRGADLSGANLSGAILTNADLSGAKLQGVDLSGADLQKANLSEANLRRANLTEAFIIDADLTDAFLEEADLTEASLRGANLREAYLWGADLTEAFLERANLREATLDCATLHLATLRDANLTEASLERATLTKAGLIGADLSAVTLMDADLTDAALIEVDLSDIALNRGTQMETELADMKERVSNFHRSEHSESPQIWDTVARMNHNIKKAYSTNGLVGRARDHRLKERRARRKEARAEGGFTGWAASVVSLLSFVFTGYGIRLWPIVVVMLGLYLGSAAWYWWVGVENSLYYSIVTFTTAPPGNPPAGAQLVSMAETLLGTLFIVLLGYVLGNREQV